MSTRLTSENHADHNGIVGASFHRESGKSDSLHGDVSTGQNASYKKEVQVSPKTVGILGGMGPSASTLLLEMITQHTRAKKDQDHLDLLIYSKASVPDRTELLMAHQEEALMAELLHGCRVLEQAGVDVLALSCNTAHVMVPQLSLQLNTAFLNMIDLACKEAKNRAQDTKRVAVLATDGTIDSGLYQKALAQEGLKAYVPSTQTQKHVMHIIYDKIKAGRSLETTLWEPIANELRQSACDCAILACTELSLAARELPLDGYYVDAMQELARAIIEFTGREYIELRSE